MYCPDAQYQSFPGGPGAPVATDSANLSSPTACAGYWWSLLTNSAAGPGSIQCVAPPTLASSATDALALLTAHALAAGKSFLLLVPDDEFLPAFSSALDIGTRPLCLVLPSADFAARIAMRATLSLLKSRLTRDSDEEQTTAWSTQRRLIAGMEVIWHAAQAWNSSNARSDWPPATPQLFPVRILPVAAFRSQPTHRADIVVCFCCDPGMDAPQLGERLLFIGGRNHQNHAGSSHRTLALSDEASQLATELAQLTQDVAELELELATAQAEMADFTRRYYSHVGRRMTELDALRAKLAGLQLERMRVQTATPAQTEQPDAASRSDGAQAQYEHLRAQAERSREESERFARADSETSEASEGAAFRPDTRLKHLFRQLAQRIHPDRATDEEDRAWRTQLMSEANRAYRAGDAQALGEVASLWQEGGAGVKSALRSRSAMSPQAMLRKQIAAMRRRFDAITAELHRLFGSSLYEIFLAARQIGRFGRDLLQEMADKLDAQIGDVLAALRALESCEP